MKVLACGDVGRLFTLFPVTSPRVRYRCTKTDFGIRQIFFLVRCKYILSLCASETYADDLSCTSSQPLRTNTCRNSPRLSEILNRIVVTHLTLHDDITVNRHIHHSTDTIVDNYQLYEYIISSCFCARARHSTREFNVVVLEHTNVWYAFP